VLLASELQRFLQRTIRGHFCVLVATSACATTSKYSFLPSAQPSLLEWDERLDFTSIFISRICTCHRIIGANP